MTQLLTALVLALLVWAAVRDLLYRRIGNALVTVLTLLWLAGLWLRVSVDGVAPGIVLDHALSTLPGATAVLVVGFLLFRRRLVGAGDVKLMAVLCLWTGAQMQLAFLAVTSVAGGVLVLLAPTLASIETHAAALWWSWVSRRQSLRHVAPPYCLRGPHAPGIPYAPAILIGASLTLTLPIQY